MERPTDRMQLAEQRQKRIQENLASIRSRVVVFSGKGGVGKTTVAVNLACALAKREKRVGLLDADVTGPNVPKMIGLHTAPLVMEDGRISPPQKEGVKVVSLATLIPLDAPVIWRGPLRSRALEQFLGDVSWGDLDFLVADLPPGTGDEVMTMTQDMKPDVAVIVTTPQEMSLIDCRRAVNMAKKMAIPKIMLVENMSGLRCPGCGQRIEVFGAGGGEQLAGKLQVTFLGRIPINLRAREAADKGTPILALHAETDIAQALLRITDAFLKMTARQVRMAANH